MAFITESIGTISKDEERIYMTFISYAQNFEDITLWRALKFFPKGFYIDIGASDPTSDSVTKAFYERDWHGINIEPIFDCYDRLCAERPRDINLHAAASNVDGETVFFENIDKPLESTVDAATAHISRDGGMQMKEYRIATVTLRSVCEEYVNSEIHFLKIDAEGHEGEVLQGMNFQKWRPWVVLIEIPYNIEPDWGKTMVDARYNLVHYDGINRYYLAEEHMDLKGAFDTPPSVLDDFKLCYGHHLSYPVADLEERTRRAEANLSAIHKSYRWKIIHPLTLLRQFARNLTHKGGVR